MCTELPSSFLTETAMPVHFENVIEIIEIKMKVRKSPPQATRNISGC